MAIGTALGALFVASCLLSSTVTGLSLVPKRITFGFAIDKTGSMSSEIKFVRQAIYNATYHLTHYKMLGIDKFVMATFSDPKSLTNVTTFTSLHDLHTAVSNLKVTGGGDCAEYGLDGLDKAIQMSNEDSFIFYFSDASVKEEYLASTVISKAKAKNIRIWIVGTGCCSGKCADYSTYNSIAKGTGGVYYPVVDNKIPQIMRLVNIYVRCKKLDQLRNPPPTYSGVEAWLKSHPGCILPPVLPPLPPTIGAPQLTAHFLTMVVTAFVAATFV